MLGDDVWLRGLTGAGLCAVPTELDRPVEATRRADVHVAGRGIAAVEMRGRPGKGVDDAPVLALTGRPPPAPVFRGDARAAPPPEVGPVRVREVVAASTTEYLRAPPHRPLRGDLVLDLPHERGPTMHRRFSFTLVVR
jgi:hypothetical protein